MAKKRKEPTEEEELDFKLPKFDEEKFLKRERRNIKTLFISCGFGLLLALISFGFWVLLSDSVFRWELVLLIGVFNASWIRYIFLKLNIDLTDFGRRGWFGTYALYFFTWLIVLIILCNPPFYDDQPPQVNVISLPEMQEAGGSVKIVAYITDNAGPLEKNDLEFYILYPDGTNTTPEFDFENNMFSYTYDNMNHAMGNYQFGLIAQDKSGRITTEKGTFRYTNETIVVPEPAGADTAPGASVTYATTIKFDVDTAVSRVYYTINNGSEINATIQGDFYETYPKYVGWEKNTNATMKVYAEIIYYFDNIDQQFNNTIVDSSTYYFQVGSERIGEEPSPTIALPQYQPVLIPGFELAVFLLSLGCILILFKRRKNNIRP